MQAIILAGGSGTRLRPLTYTTPKPMLPIGGRPAVVRIAQDLAKAGFSEVFITTNYLAEVIEERLQEYSLSIPVRCIREDKPLGTAGCVKNALEFLEDEFLVIQGDAVADVDYAALLAFHRERQADVTITAIRVQDPRDFGIIEAQADGRIRRFQEKPLFEEAFSDLANAGFYVLRKSVFENVPAGEPFDFSRQLFPLLMEQDKRFFAFELSSYWVDIGRPQSYLEGNTHALKGCAEVADDIEIPDDAVLVAPFIIGAGTQLGAGCVIGPGTVIGRGCRIGARSQISGSVLFDDISTGESSTLNGCVVAMRSHIGARASIGVLAMIGDGCDIGVDAEVAPYSRVGPITPVAAGTIVEGVVSPRLERLSSLQRAVVHAPAAMNFDQDQKFLYGLLAEFGELSMTETVRISGLDPEVVNTNLNFLEANGYVLTTLDRPRRYALTREIPTSPRRILLVDDSADALAIYALALTMHGFSVQTAENGPTAVELAQHEAFDFVVTDISMPGMNGFETIEKLRSSSLARSTPMLFFTALANDETRHRARELRVDGVLQKPVLPQELISRLIEILRAQ